MLHKTNDVVKQVTGVTDRKKFFYPGTYSIDFCLYIKFKGNGSKCSSWFPKVKLITTVLFLLVYLKIFTLLLRLLL